MTGTSIRKLAFGAMALAGLAASAAMAADNLVPDPDFKKVQFEPPTYESSWVPYQINSPYEAKLDAAAGKITLTGGKTFLHSSKFAVSAGKAYAIGLQAEGKGKVSVECLWWTADGGMTEPHRTIPVEPVELKGEPKALEGKATAPTNAATLYIRAVVEDGTITLAKPVVTAAP